jgi:hypothetical protein
MLERPAASADIDIGMSGGADKRMRPNVQEDPRQEVPEGTTRLESAFLADEYVDASVVF